MGLCVPMRQKACVQALFQGGAAPGAHGLWHVLDSVLERQQGPVSRALGTLVRLVCVVLGQVVERAPDSIVALCGNPAPERARVRANTLQAMSVVMTNNRHDFRAGFAALKSLFDNAMAISQAQEHAAAAADGFDGEAAAAGAEAADEASGGPQSHEDAAS